MRDREPSIQRTNAQVAQTMRDLRCVHPDKFVRTIFLESGGYVEICTQCSRVMDLWEP